VVLTQDGSSFDFFLGSHGNPSTNWPRLHRDYLVVSVLFPIGAETRVFIENKKADVVQHPKAFDHVGLPFIEPPGKAGLFFV
jgi:hypothetical protein